MVSGSADPAGGTTSPPPASPEPARRSTSWTRSTTGGVHAADPGDDPDGEVVGVVVRAELAEPLRLVQEPRDHVDEQLVPAAGVDDLAREADVAEQHVGALDGVDASRRDHQELLQLLQGLRAEVARRLLRDPLDDLGRGRVDGGTEDVLLGVEALVGGPHGDPGAARQHLHGDGRVLVLAQELLGAAHQPARHVLVPVGTLLGAAPGELSRPPVDRGGVDVELGRDLLGAHPLVEGAGDRGATSRDVDRLTGSA